MKYVVDTCVINKLVDGLLTLNQLPNDGDYIASHIQIDELNKTKNTERRAQLLLRFAITIKTVVPTETALVGIARTGHCKISDGKLHNQLRSGLDALNNAKSNNSMDALIAEIAIKNGYTLITTDYHLKQVAGQHGCSLIYIQV